MHFCNLVSISYCEMRFATNPETKRRCLLEERVRKWLIELPR